MLIIGHLSLGYLVSLVLAKLLNISSSFPYYNTLIVIGVIAAIIPDLDFFLLFYKHKSLKLQRDDSHRKYLTHTLLFWVIISGLIFLIASNEVMKYASFFILMGGLSHLAGDSIEYGVMWLWPFLKKKYSMHKIPKENFKANEPLLRYYWKFFSQIYIKNGTFYVELILIVVALATII